MRSGYHVGHHVPLVVVVVGELAKSLPRLRFGLVWIVPTSTANSIMYIIEALKETDVFCRKRGLLGEFGVGPTSRLLANPHILLLYVDHRFSGASLAQSGGF